MSVTGDFLLSAGGITGGKKIYIWRPCAFPWHLWLKQMRQIIGSLVSLLGWGLYPEAFTSQNKRLYLYSLISIEAINLTLMINTSGIWGPSASLILLKSSLVCDMSSLPLTAQWAVSDIFGSKMVLQSCDKATSAQHDVEDGAGEGAWRWFYVKGIVLQNKSIYSQYKHSVARL